MPTRTNERWLRKYRSAVLWSCVGFVVVPIVLFAGLFLVPHPLMERLYRFVPSYLLPQVVYSPTSC